MNSGLKVISKHTRRRLDRGNASGDCLESGSIDPVYVLDEQEHWSGTGEAEKLTGQRRDRELLLPLGSELQGGIASTGRDRQEGSIERGVRKACITGLRQHGLELIQFSIGQILPLEARCTLELIDDGKEGAVGMVRRALVANLDMRLLCDGVQECHC